VAVMLAEEGYEPVRQIAIDDDRAPVQEAGGYQANGACMDCDGRGQAESRIKPTGIPMTWNRPVVKELLNDDFNLKHPRQPKNIG